MVLRDSLLLTAMGIGRRRAPGITARKNSGFGALWSKTLDALSFLLSVLEYVW